MDRIKTRAIAADAMAALQAVATKHGLVVKYSGGSYGMSNAALKFEFAEKASNGAVLTREAVDFQQYASVYGLKPDDLGRQFQHNGYTYKIVGLNARAHKMPIQAVRLDGKTFKFPENVVRLSLVDAA